jgi:hypothetical protein
MQLPWQFSAQKVFFLFGTENYCKCKGIEAKLVEKCSYFKVMAMAEVIYFLAK